MADIIKLMKQRVLDMAIRGELVEQREEESNAKELLAQINLEKDNLINVGTLKKEKAMAKIEEGEIPFDIPDNWEWVRLNNIIDVRDGTHDTPKYQREGIPLITSKNLKSGKLDLSNIKYISHEDHKKIEKRSKVDSGDILFAMIGSIGNSVLVKKEMEFSIKNVALFKNYPLCQMDMKYINFMLQSSDNHFKKIASGGVQAFLSLSFLRRFPIPLPPLSEQKRIVTKIESAFAVIDKINEKKADSLQTIKNIRKTALQNAVQGLLIEQDESDEPVSELLKKIKAEKEQLIKDKKIKKEKLLHDIEKDEIPFDIPNSWKWFRLKELVYNKGQKKPDTIFSYIDISSIDNLRNKLSDEENIVKSEDAPSRARKIVSFGDIIYSTVRPYLHNVCIINKNFVAEPIASTGFAVMTTYKSINNKFIFYYLLSSSFDNYVNNTQNSTGTTYPAINDKKFYNAVVPVPPLCEQKRIVEKLDLIIEICDKMEDKLK